MKIETVAWGMLTAFLVSTNMLTYRLKSDLKQKLQSTEQKLEKINHDRMRYTLTWNDLFTGLKFADTNHNGIIEYNEYENVLRHGGYKGVINLGERPSFECLESAISSLKWDIELEWRHRRHKSGF